MFDSTKCTFKEMKLPRSNFELVAAHGNIPGTKRKVVVIGLYLPPKYSSKRSREALDKLGDAISLAKRTCLITL